MYDITLGQNGHFNQRHQLKEPYVFDDPCI
jgi:hypothetical protein